MVLGPLRKIWTRNKRVLISCLEFYLESEFSVYFRMIDCSFYSLAYFLYSFVTIRFKYFSYGLFSSFYVKLKYQP